MDRNGDRGRRLFGVERGFHARLHSTLRPGSHVVEPTARWSIWYDACRVRRLRTLPRRVGATGAHLGAAGILRLRAGIRRRNAITAHGADPRARVHVVGLVSIARKPLNI